MNMHRRAFAAATAGLLTTTTTAAVPDRQYQLGMVTYNIAAKWDLATILRVCKEVGLAAIEFRTTHPHGVEPSLSPEDRQVVKRKCQDAGIAIWGCGTTCEFHSPDRSVVDKNIDECKRFVQLVANLGGKGVKVRPNDLPKGVEPARTLAQIGQALVHCGKAAQDAGIDICVEVHGKGTSQPAAMKTIMETCNHPSVGMTWNSNATDIVNGSIRESFNMLKPWIRSCHINELYRDGKSYPYRELFALLHEMNYDRYTMIEVARTPGDTDSAVELLKYYRALWQQLSN